METAHVPMTGRTSPGGGTPGADVEAPRTSRPSPTPSSIESFLTGVVVTVALLAVAARFLLPRVDSIGTLVAWSDSVFWAAGGVVFLANALSTRRRSREPGRSGGILWPLQVAVALGWFVVAFLHLP